MTSDWPSAYEEILREWQAEHLRKRQEAKALFRRDGLRWRWRVYYGRYVEGPRIIVWREYEEGVNWTRRGSRRAAARRLRKFRKADAPWQS